MAAHARGEKPKLPTREEMTSQIHKFLVEPEEAIEELGEPSLSSTQASQPAPKWMSSFQTKEMVQEFINKGRNLND